MREFGWIDGQTAQFIVRYDLGDASRFPALARELVALGVDVLVVIDRAIPAARDATSTIPIVALDMFDPIAEGVTSSLAKPTGNITGVSWNSIETAVKRLELAMELIPGLRRVALLTDANDTGAVAEAEALQAKTPRLGVKLRIFAARHPGQFPVIFAAIKKDRPELLIVSTCPLMIVHLDEIARFIASAGLPSVSEDASFADAGFLLTYGPDYVSTYKRGAVQVDRILRGAKPADLAFELPTTYEIVVNIKTAKRLRINVPESIMVRSTRVVR